MTDRPALSAAFLNRAGWGSADRTYLAGDASDRSYDRLRRNGETAVLMNAPPGQADDPAKFLTIAAYLAGSGLSAPRCLAQDLTNGFLLLEDLGDEIYAKIIVTQPALERPIYEAAVDVLAHLQTLSPPKDLPDLSASDWATAAGFAVDWYGFAITGDRPSAEALQATLTDLLQQYADGPRRMILRDYHAENLIWLPNRLGLARVGLLDFQLAQMGQPGYDLVSLLQDARRDVPMQTEKAMKTRYVRAIGAESAAFAPAYAVLGAQRALRILGVFARLCLVAGKPGYLPLIPRVWNHLQRNLAVPALAPLAKVCAGLLPEPTPQALAVIGSKCGHFR